MKKITIAIALLFSSITANAAWWSDGSIMYSNVCRQGLYWQYTTWAPVGTSCYMPMINSYGYRTAE